jgi:hypothetical protein
MRSAPRSFLALAVLLTTPVLAQEGPKPPEKPFLWLIEGAEKPSFLYGTIHVPDARVTTLPPVVEEAVDLCDGLFCELPMEPAQQMAAQGKMMLPKGKGLKELLSPELYQRTEAVLKSKGLPGLMPPLTQMKPWALASQIQMLDFMQDLMSGKQPLDALLYSRAQKAGKEVGGLETMDEQIGAMEGIDGVQMLEQTVAGEEKAAKEGKKATAALIEMWLSGDEAGILAEAKKDQEGVSPEFKAKFEQLLLTDRNKRMAERIAAKLQENPGKSYFFAVGTFHHLGEEGVVALLQKQGLTIRRLSSADAGKLVPEAAGAPR